MRLSVASCALAAAFVLTPLAAGFAPALGQDFSITNQDEPGTAVHRDLMRQLQAIWDARAYYPKHASNSEKSGTVKVHLVIHPDGKIWTADLVSGSTSHALDAAGEAVFRGAFVRPFPAAEPNAELDIALHYVLAHRADQPTPAGYTPVLSKTPFTITNDPARSPILDTMLQKVCTGSIILGGVANHPSYGVHSWAQAIFFRKPDGTPWVKFYERGFPSLSPVTEVGKMLTWTGRTEWFQGQDSWLQYTVWPDGNNHVSGAVSGRIFDRFGVASNNIVAGNSVDLTCADKALPTVAWNDLLAQTLVVSPIDPP